MPHFRPGELGGTYWSLDFVTAIAASFAAIKFHLANTPLEIRTSLTERASLKFVVR
jgi:hypothetical protein